MGKYHETHPKMSGFPQKMLWKIFRFFCLKLYLSHIQNQAQPSYFCEN